MRDLEGPANGVPSADGAPTAPAPGGNARVGTSRGRSVDEHLEQAAGRVDANPDRPTHIVCAECGTFHPVKPKGVVPKFCSSQCRRNYRNAEAGLRPTVEPELPAAEQNQQSEQTVSDTTSRSLVAAGHRVVPKVRLGTKRRRVNDPARRADAADETHTEPAPAISAARPRVARRSDIRLLRRTFREARPYRLHIVGLFALSLLSTPLALLAPVPLAVAVDSAVGSEPLPAYLQPLVPASVEQSETGVLLLAAILLVVVALSTSLQSLATSALQISTGEKLTLGFQSKLLQHVQRPSFAFHDNRGTADSIYRIQYDAASIQRIAIASIIPFATAGFTLIAMLVIILRIDWQLALVALAVSPFLFGYARYYRNRMRPKYKHVKRLESSSLEIVQEVLTSFRVVKAFGREQDEGRRFVDKTQEGADARIRLTIGEEVFGLLVNVTTAVGTAVVLYVGMTGVRAGTLTLGSVLLVLSYVAQLYGPLKTISSRAASLQQQLASAERAFDLLDEVPDVREHPGAIRLDRARGNISFRRVSFSYDGETEALRAVSFVVPAGSTVGVVGKTGSGKTTLVSLLTRFYDPSSGHIYLDGVDLRDYKLRDLRSQFTIMLQEPVLFSTSIADNVAYARPEASFDDIVKATTAAGAHEFVSALPEGYHTVVGERGMRLSGGERQRISLARAFLKDAPVLILDEPTSSVDVRTEAQIMDAMERLMEGRTTFIIAHRLGTLGRCNILVSLEKGKAEVRPKRRRRTPVTTSRVPTGRVR